MEAASPESSIKSSARSHCLTAKEMQRRRRSSRKRSLGATLLKVMLRLGKLLKSQQSSKSANKSNRLFLCLFSREKKKKESGEEKSLLAAIMQTLSGKEHKLFTRFDMTSSESSAQRERKNE